MEGRVGYTVRRKVKEFVQKRKDAVPKYLKGTCSDHANRDIEDCCKKIERRNKCLP